MDSPQNSISNIKSISQIHKEITDKRKEIQKIFQQKSKSQLSQWLDYQRQNITIDKVFAQIPSEDTLRQSLEKLPNVECLEQKLKFYNGEYQIVKKAGSRSQIIKPEAKQMYGLFIQLNLPKVRQDFKKNKQNYTIKLSSYELSRNQSAKDQSMQQQKNQQGQYQVYQASNIHKKQQIKTSKFQRNTISQDYIYSLKESSRYEQILPPSQYLKEDDLLVHVCIYDSINGQKQHEIIFLGDMKLIDLKKQIYCKIQKLSKDNEQPNSNNGKKQKQYEEKSFFFIQESLYYQGTHHSQFEIQSLKKNIELNYECKINKYSMNNTEIKNLRVVFGRPYLYRHMGGCDHMIVFKDVRLFDTNGIDPQIKTKYPLMVFESKMKRKKCEGCDHNYAGFICLGDKLKNGVTSYLCKQCHENIHNDLTNPLNPLLKVIPYIHE